MSVLELSHRAYSNERPVSSRCDLVVDSSPRLRDSTSPERPDRTPHVDNPIADERSMDPAKGAASDLHRAAVPDRGVRIVPPPARCVQDHPEPARFRAPRGDWPGTSCGHEVADEVLQEQGNWCLCAIFSMGRTILRGLVHVACRPRRRRCCAMVRDLAGC